MMESCSGAKADFYRIQDQNHTSANVTPVCDVAVTQRHYTDALSSLGIVYLLIAIFGCITNAHVTYKIVHFKKFRRKFTNVILLHMGISQLLTCIIIAPVYGIVLLLHQAVHMADKTCDVIGSVSCGLTLLSLGTLVALNIDKYKAITLPLKHSTYVTKLRLIFFISSVWIFAVVTVFAIHLLGPGFRYSPYFGGCSLDFSNQEQSVAAIIMLSATFLLPTVILLACYSRIFAIARSHRRHIVGLLHKLAFQAQVPLAPRLTRQSSFVQDYAMAGDRKAVGSILLITGSFVVIYLPFGGVCIHEAITRSHLHPLATMIVSLLFRLHPLVNALVYGFHNKVFTVKACVASLKNIRNRLDRRNARLQRVETELEFCGRPVFEL